MASKRTLLEFTIMAASRLGNGICVAGIRVLPDSYEWIRPTRQTSPGWRQLERADLIGYHGQQNQELTKIGNVVQWDIANKMEDVDSHIEDYCHPLKATKLLVKQYSPSEFLHFIAEREQSEAAKFEKYLDNEFNLIVIRPAAISHIFMHTTKITGRHQPRISFEYQNQEFDYPVTDLDWFKFSSDCKTKGTFLAGSHKELNDTFGAGIKYLVLGSSKFRDRYWNLIVGVICDKPIPSPP